ncbi:hypothetical protein FQN57_006161 [Myotisia sp. PD_48]|nr:hypothetical protein FQN57_006161 [Myotisia sp. PD_48]
MAPGEDLINFDLIETQKENIQSLPSGRSAKALAAAFSPRPGNSKQALSEIADTRTINDAIRREYEIELETIGESDDPLDVYDRYVKWTLDAYPSAQATVQSGLLPLLERATNSFLNSSHYRNDPRYLRLWVHYIQLFSDSPRETFAFLARQGIGNGLALFYEEFAFWLEGAGRYSQAEEIYKMGIEREARPVERLFRKFEEFQRRLEQRPTSSDGPSSPALPAVRPALAAKFDPFASSSRPSQAPPPGNTTRGTTGGAVSRSGKPKMAIFSDTDERGDLEPVSSTGPGTKGWESIGSLKDRKKENTIEPTPWAGQTLKSSKKVGKAEKMMVFKDQSLSHHKSKPIQTANIPARNRERVDPRTGRIERVTVNLEAVYPDPKNPSYEMSLDELRAQYRGWMDKDWSKPNKKPLQGISQNAGLRKQPCPQRNVKEGFDKDLPAEFQGKLMIHDDGNLQLQNENALSSHSEHKASKSKKLKTKEIKGETQTVKTNLDSPTGPKIKRKGASEPTMTFHTRAATDEIYSIFNQPLKSELERADNPESLCGSDYEDDGFTSTGESTATGLISAINSEYGDEDNELDDFDTTKARDNFDTQTQGGITGVSEWTDFAATEHISRLALGTQDNKTPYRSQSQSTTPPSPSPGGKCSQNQNDGTFVLVPPEDYNPPTGPFRDAFVAAQNRLPFMTPIVEKTESSLASTMFRERTYMSSKTPSRSTISGATPAIPEIDDLLMSSPFRDLDHSDDTEYPDDGGSPGRRASKFRTAPIKSPILQRGIPQSRIIIEEAQCNPIELAVREKILANISPPLKTYPGYCDHSVQVGGNSGDIKRYFKALNRSSKTSAGELPQPIICLSGSARTYAIQKELGEGGFAPVYLAESIDSPDTFSSDSESEHEFGLRPGKNLWGRGYGKPCRDIDRKSLEAIKVESDASAWEFYMLRVASARLEISDIYSRVKESVVQSHEMHVFKDESILIEDYLDQGTLLDLINIRTDPGNDQGLDEAVIMFFAVELFRTVEALHACGIIHGDLKPDNCLVRLNPSASANALATPDTMSLLDNDADFDNGNIEYSPTGSFGWRNKGITLIDFGRGIDMHAFLPTVQFIADWKVAAHECTEMKEFRPWTHQIDLYGLAGTIYIMLFGKYMEVCPVNGAKNGGGPNGDTISGGLGGRKIYRIKESLKRYWEREIWSEVFDLCLNPLSPKWIEIERDARRTSPLPSFRPEEDLDHENAPVLPMVHSMRLVREKMEAWLVANAGRKGLQHQLNKLAALVTKKKVKRVST